MPLNEDIGYVNANNNNELEPKVTPAENKKTQTPENLTDNDANALIDFIKEDRVQINANEQSISNKADQTSLDTLDNRVTTIEGDYLTSTDKTELQDNIDLKADQTALDTVETKADNAQAKADANETAIGDLAIDLTVLDSEVVKNTSVQNDDAEFLAGFKGGVPSKIDASTLTPKTNTSQLTNDGSDGINPFITANDLPPSLTQVIYNENDFDYELDTSVSAFKIDVIKIGRQITFFCELTTNTSSSADDLWKIPQELRPDASITNKVKTFTCSDPSTEGLVSLQSNNFRRVFYQFFAGTPSGVNKTIYINMTYKSLT